jgi:two-component system LytT family response regulator
MLNALIIDDEETGAKTLNALLKKYCPDVKVLAIAYSAKEALKMIPSLNPDLVFLDIYMPLVNGFELLAQLEKINFEVIFTTAYNEHAINAIRHNALDYLLKPIQKDELINAVLKCNNRLKANSPELQKIENVLHGLTQTVKGTKITVYTHDEIIYIDIDDVIRFEGDSNYTKIFLKDGQKIVSSKTLTVYEQLVKELHFFRIHKTHIVNLSHVKKYLKGDGGYVVMSDGSKLDVSPQKKLELLGRLPG